MSFDFVGFTPMQSGPGGAAALSYGEIGGGGVQTGGTLPANSVVGAPGSSGLKIPPVLWMFLFLIIGYWGLHMSLKVV